MKACKFANTNWI